MSDEPVFKEHTAASLAAELATRGLGDAVEIEVQAADGSTLMAGLVMLAVSTGTDFDRSGGYAWTRITARLEPSTHRPARTMRGFSADEVPMGSMQPIWSHGGGAYREVTDRRTDGDVFRLYFDHSHDGVEYDPRHVLHVFPPEPGWQR